MNKRQRKKRAKRLGLPFDDRPRSRRRRPESTRPAEAPGRPPVRPSRRRRAALEAAAEAQSERRRQTSRAKHTDETPPADPTVAAAPSLAAAVVGLARATGELAGEVVKQTLTVAQETVEGAVDRVPVVGAPIARELRHLTREEDEDEPPTRADEEEPLT